MERRKLQTEVVIGMMQELKKFVRPSYISVKLGVSRNTVHLWSKGRALPNAVHMVALERILERYQELHRST